MDFFLSFFFFFFHNFMHVHVCIPGAWADISQETKLFMASMSFVRFHQIIPKTKATKTKTPSMEYFGPF